MANGAATSSVNCPQCSHRLEVPTSSVGKRGRCPFCKNVFVVELPITAELAPTATPDPSFAPTPAAPAYAPFPQQQPWPTPTAAPFPTAGYSPNPFSAPPPMSVGQPPSPFGPTPAAYPGAPSPFAAPPSPFSPASPQAPAGDAQEMTFVQKIGIFVFVITSGFTALNQGGFMGHPIWFPLALFISTFGGLIGGTMLAPTHRWAGAIGGVIAGPIGLIAIALYVHGRQQVWNVELVLVQLVACLPGLGVYRLLKMLAG